MRTQSIIKKGCLIASLIVIFPLVIYVGAFYYWGREKRSFVELEGCNTITIWKNEIIFDKYWLPFHPTKNFFCVKDTYDGYDISFTITTDSILAIWCNYPVEVCRLNDFKSVEIFEKDNYSNWSNRYSSQKVVESRRDSLRVELSFRMWYPCSPTNGVYIYRTDTAIVKGYFD